MLPPDAYLKGIAAAVSIAFGVAVLAANPRRPQNAFLAAFLFLIGGNQAMETLRAVYLEDPVNLVAFRIATIFAALDPLFLYAFASIFPARNALNRTLPLALVAATSGAFALAAPFLFPLERYRIAANYVLVGLTVFTAVVYTIVLVHALSRYKHAHDKRSAGLAYAALCFAAFPLWSRVFHQGALQAFIAYVESPITIIRIPLVALASFAAIYALHAYARRFGWFEPGDRAIRTATLAGAFFVAVTILGEFGALLAWFHLAQPDVGDAAIALARGTVPLRWLLFGALVSMAIFRYHMMDHTLAARRRAARVLLGFGVVALTALAIVTATIALDLPPPSVGPVELTLLGAALVLSQGFRRLVDLAAWHAYGVPMPGDAAAAHDLYQRAVAQAAAAGRSPQRDAELVRLRADLGIDDTRARVLERLAETGSRGPFEPGQIVAGRYRLERVLGEGGSGRAFLARDETLDRRVVLKEVAHARDAALREARVAGGLLHPRIVKVHDVIEHHGGVLLVTEHAEGGSLHERLAAGPLSHDAALRLIDDVLDGLAAVHARGIVHRDLKPGNVLLDAEGRALIADFGVARHVEGRTVMLDGGGAFVGTPGFMAPEQKDGKATTPATDVYLVGLLARTLAPEGLGPEIERVIGTALQFDPKRRWTDAAAMRAALRRARSSVEHEERAPETDDVAVTERDHRVLG